MPLCCTELRNRGQVTARPVQNNQNSPDRTLVLFGLTANVTRMVQPRLTSREIGINVPIPGSLRPLNHFNSSTCERHKNRPFVPLP